MRPTVIPLHALHALPRLRPTATPHGVCTVHFGELQGPVLDFIAGSEVIVGCVAWITSGKILDALATKQVCLAVQKENWWKKTDNRGASLARRYASLTGALPASAFPAPLGTKTFRGKEVPNDSPMAPIQCVGYGSSSQFQPLMHHKFLVRCTLDADGTLVPLAVWTGSANLSENSNASLENAVVIADPIIAAAYLAEFALVASLSEPMNWRFARPSPKGAGVAAFVAPPAKPKKTTARVVSGAARKRASTKTKTGTPIKKTAASGRPAQKKVAARRSTTRTTVRSIARTSTTRRKTA